ncbi:tyrosine N-monooxygenase-like [Carex rostrata]
MMINTLVKALLNPSPHTFSGAILIFTLLFVFQKYRPKKVRISKQNQLPPGPMPWPLVGCLPAMLQQKPVSRWIHLLMKDMNTDIACVRIGKVHVISITCPKIAQEVVRKKDAILASRPTSFATNLLVGGTIFCPFGDQWKKMRRILTSEVVCPARHCSLYDKRADEANHLVQYVYNLCQSSKDIDIRVVARHYCGNVTRRLMFNKRYFSQVMPDGGPGADEIEQINAIFDLLRYIFAFCISDYFPSLIGLDLDGHEKILKTARKTLDKLHDPIITERIKLWRQGSSDSERETQDWLDVLVSLKDADGHFLLTAEEIKTQTIELFLASVDNPSHAVECILAEMMNNPDVLQEATNEIDRVVGNERLVDECDIPRLNYLKACIREAIRLHPLVPFNPPHQAMEDTTIAGYFIPKGSHVLLSRLGLGRNPKTWEEPLKFKPERHLTDKCSDVLLTEPELRFISFSSGRRGCLGVTLGTTMTVILLARLL